MDQSLDYFTQRYRLSNEELRTLYTQLRSQVTALLDAVPEYEGLALETRHLFINNRAQVEAILMAPFKQSFSAVRQSPIPPRDPVGALCGDDAYGSMMTMYIAAKIECEAPEISLPPETIHFMDECYLSLRAQLRSDALSMIRAQCPPPPDADANFGA